MTGEPRDLVVIGTHPFVPGVPLGDWQLARALARRHRVLWVDPPASPLAVRRGVASDAMFASRPVPAGDRVLVGSPIVPSGRPVALLCGIVERVVTAQVNRWTRQLGMPAPDVVSFAPRLGSLRGLRRGRLVAWLKDRDWAAPGVGDRAWLRQRQIELVRHADVVAAVSPTLVEDCRRLGVDAVRIANGCDIGLFSAPTPEPVAMRDLARPRIVFAGAWNDRVDNDLVAAVAARLPEASIVLIGAVAAAVPPAANVHVLGPVPYADLPAHLQAGDVGIVPYRSSAFNDASCPLKVLEYLAAGLPVVASAVDVGGLGGFVQRHDDTDGFVAAAESFGRRDARTACRAVAAEHSWEARASELLAALDGGRVPVRTAG